MKQTIDCAGCNDLFEVLAYVSSLEQSGRIFRVADGTDLSRNIRNTILDNPKLKPQNAALDQQNIKIFHVDKRFARLIIERV